MLTRLPFSYILHHMFFFNDTATTEIYTLSLHDALPIYALAVLELAAHQVAGALGGDHGDVDAGRGLDVAEPDVEAVAEEQRVAVLQVGLDRLRVQPPLHVVRNEDHDQDRKSVV